MGLREELSLKYLKGEGIEIGALQRRLSGPASSRDVCGQMHQQELVALILEPDIICDGATLEAVGDASLDFVIANHLVKHMADPLKGLENWIRVPRPGGILYLAVPDTAEELVALAEKRYGVKTLVCHNDQESNELVWILRKTLTGSRGQRSSTGDGAR